MSLLIGLLVVLVTLIAPSRPQELRNGTACKEEILQLVCGPEEVLVIHQAFFDGRDTEGCGFLMPINISTLLNVSAEDVEPINTRRFSVQSSVNRRCSGFNNCTLQLENDEPSAKQWGEGKLRVQYNCIPVKSARYSCDSIIEIAIPEKRAQQQQDLSGSAPKTAAVLGETTTTGRPTWFPGPNQVQGWGYVHQMGYPEYYRAVTGERSDCRWTIRATHGRRVRLTLLDLSIRSVLHGERECKDVVTVTENSRMLLNKCGEIEEPLVIESAGDELNLTLQIKSQFIPKRGLMAYFTAMGCPTPKVPNKAYLVSGSNSSHADFSCCVDHVFPDTGSRFRSLTCLDHEGHRWSEDLPDCVDIKEIHNSGNKSLIHKLKKAMNQSTGPEVSGLTNYNMTYDVIVPSSIIAGLVLGNLIVLILVLHCRRRNTKKNAKSNNGEENVPLQETPGPSDVTAQQQQRVGTPV